MDKNYQNHEQLPAADYNAGVQMQPVVEQAVQTESAANNPYSGLEEWLQEFFGKSFKLGSPESQEMLKEFFRYLYRYNIIPCDLRLDNLLVQTTQTENKLIAVDGLGSTDAINIAQYLPCWGHKKIIRKIIFFLTNHPENLSLFDNPQEINHWVNTEILSSK